MMKHVIVLLLIAAGVTIAYAAGDPQESIPEVTVLAEPVPDTGGLAVEDEALDILLSQARVMLSELEEKADLMTEEGQGKEARWLRHRAAELKRAIQACERSRKHRAVRTVMPVPGPRLSAGKVAISGEDGIVLHTTPRITGGRLAVEVEPRVAEAPELLTVKGNDVVAVTPFGLSKIAIDAPPLPPDRPEPVVVELAEVEELEELADLYELVEIEEAEDTLADVIVDEEEDLFSRAASRARAADDRRSARARARSRLAVRPPGGRAGIAVGGSRPGPARDEPGPTLLGGIAGGGAGGGRAAPSSARSAPGPRSRDAARYLLSRAAGLPDAKAPQPDSKLDKLIQKLHHMNAAQENLHAAGLHDHAEGMVREVEMLKQKIHSHQDTHLQTNPEPDSGLHDKVQELQEEVKDLRSEVRELRKTVQELRNRLRSRDRAR